MTVLASSLLSTAAALHVDRLRSIRERLDPAWITHAIERGEAISVRRRKMPLDVVVWLVVGISLFGEKNFVEVLRLLGLTPPTRRGNAQVLPTTSAIAQARQRLGAAPMAELFRTSAQHWYALPDFDHLRFHGLRVLAADGVTMRIADTPTNVQEFGKPSSRREDAAYPQVRAVCVADAATHLVIDAAVGAYYDGETTLFGELVERLPSRSVTILDRNFNAYGLLHRIQASGADRHWLVRAKRTMAYREVRALGPGDTLVELQTSPRSRKGDPNLPLTLLARRIEYQLAGRSYVVLTSLLEPAEYPAAEVAALYRSRWELEMVFDDIKTEQRGAAITLRSKLSTGVYQEVYGLLIGHNLVRVEMARSAFLFGVAPTRISFHRSLGIVREKLMSMGQANAPSKLAQEEVELRGMLCFLILPERRSHRRYPRALKVVVAKYPRKVGFEPQDSS
jgi:hypothetical protein